MSATHEHSKNRGSANSFFFQLTYWLRTRPLFLMLLPVFFVLHGYNGNFSSIPAADAWLLIIFYIIIALSMAGVVWLLYRDLTKACLIAFLLMAFHFFFGSIQDLVKNFSPGSFISQYRFLLPACLLVIFLTAVWFKKRKKTLLILTSYLNILLLVLILIDAGWLIIKMNGAEKNRTLHPETINFTISDSCDKPDVYLILLDQYAGNTALKEVFNFNNDAFENELNKRGFHIVQNSISNYNLTPFSMASLLNMDYLSQEMGVRKNLNVGYSYHLIQNSRVVQLLTTNGYQFYNHSVFDFPGLPAHEYGAFLPYGTKLITSQTFTSRLTRDIRLAILEGKLPFKKRQKKIAYEYLHFNDTIFKITADIATKHTTAPKFVYAHFMLPHYPYYFNSKGDSVPIEKLSGFRKTNAHDYVEYLQYGNRRILQLADEIIAASSTPPVIMLLSDHGFRNPEKRTEHTYDFINLNAIHLPSKKYNGFYDSLSNVNQFRILFNTCFDQRFPLLKDSTIDLWD